MSETAAFTRAGVLDGFAAAAQAGGLDPFALLARHGLPAGALTDRELRLPARAVVLLLEDAARESGMPDFGLSMADVRGFATLGAVGLAMREQHDVRGALDWLMRFGWVQTESVQMHLEEHAGVAIIEIVLAPGMPIGGAQSVELSLASVTRLLKGLLGPDWWPEMVLCSHRRPITVAAHLRHFGLVPVFGAERSGLVLRRAELDRAIAGADPGMARELERYLGQVAGTRRRSHADRTGEIVQQLLPRGQCQVDRAARSFGIDRRTLHRRLAREGTSFSAIVDQVRRDLVAGYLEAGVHSLTEIAELAGYSSLSAFSRWR
ncbi:MAG: AraC family transcriptional regulator, partial [Novosphingobium sp.]|uniref:AraC family transcriptional regulator n=1 Tax=Novosphingobium sp. TaxID=1874826 RepID=UPI0032BCCC92